MLKKFKRLALMSAATLAVLVGAVTFLPLRAIAGLESPCTYLSDLISTNPLSSDLASTGDDHLRCIKVAIKTTFPNISGAVTPTHTELNFVDGVTSAIQTQLNTYTAADVLTKLLTVDGAGSGIDADLLDTFSSAEFARLSTEPIFTAVGTGTSGTARLSSTTPLLRFDDTDAAADTGIWDFQAAANVFFGTARNDSGTLAANWLVVTGNASGFTSINLAATAVQTNGVDITAASGSFTCTTTGMVTEDSGTCYYAKNGNVVTLSIPFLTGTSDAITFTITGMPAVIDGTREQFIAMRVADNSVISADNSSGISVGSSTTITVFWNSSASGFTASGIKAICGATQVRCNVTYLLN